MGRTWGPMCVVCSGLYPSLLGAPTNAVLSPAAKSTGVGGHTARYDNPTHGSPGTPTGAGVGSNGLPPSTTAAPAAGNGSPAVA